MYTVSLYHSRRQRGATQVRVPDHCEPAERATPDVIRREVTLHVPYQPFLFNCHYRYENSVQKIPVIVGVSTHCTAVCCKLNAKFVIFPVLNGGRPKNVSYAT